MALGDLCSEPVVRDRLHAAQVRLACVALLLPAIIAIGCHRDSAPSAKGGSPAQISRAKRSAAFRNLGKRAESQL
jgi:hypothetical protein